MREIAPRGAKRDAASIQKDKRGKDGGADETRTRDLRRDRPAF
jgi:hypothetical protein